MDSKEKPVPDETRMGMEIEFKPDPRPRQQALIDSIWPEIEEQIDGSTEQQHQFRLDMGSHTYSYRFSRAIELKMKGQDPKRDARRLGSAADHLEQAVSIISRIGSVRREILLEGVRDHFADPDDPFVDLIDPVLLLEETRDTAVEWISLIRDAAGARARRGPKKLNPEVALLARVGLSARRNGVLNDLPCGKDSPFPRICRTLLMSVGYPAGDIRELAIQARDLIQNTSE